MKSLTVFRSAFNTVRKRYSILTVTALVVVAGVFLYYFLFLTSRSENLDRRQYRVLNRIESQLGTNLEGYRNLALGQSRAATDLLRELLAKSEKEIMKTYSFDRDAWLNEQLNDIGFLRDSRLDSGNLEFVRGEFLNPNDVTFQRVQTFAEHDAENDSLFAIRVIIPGEAEFDPVQFEFVLSVGAMIRPLLRYDTFDDFLVLKDDSIIYETASTGLAVFRADTLNEQTFGVGKTIRKAILNGSEYRVYEVGFSTGIESGWSIVGLKRAEQFAAEKRSIPRPYLFGIFIAAVFIVLSVPFIKSLIMSRTERLGTTDVIFSAVSLALATSVVAILFLDGYLRVDLDSSEQENQLIALSGTVEKHLASEISAITKELHAYTDHVHRLSENVRRREKLDAIRLEDAKQNQLLEKDKQAYSLKLKRDSMLYDSLERLLKRIDQTPYSPSYYSGFNNLFVVTASGNTHLDYSDPKLSFNVSNRRYVSAVRDKELMHMHGVEHPMFLDAIISWSEQQLRAAVAIPYSYPEDSQYVVTAVTTRLRAVTGPVLPEGSGFMIFDQGGTVLFHSDSTRSLNENIVEECDGCVQLQAAITGRTALTMEEEYAGTRYRLFVRPLKDMPYFIATFSPQAPVDAIHGQVFGMAFILQILLFSFYVIVILMGIVLMKKKSRLRLNAFDLSLFTPAVTANRRYVGAAVFNTLVGFLLFFSVGFLDGSLATILLFFVTAPYVIFLNMVQLSEHELYGFITGSHRRMSLIYVVAVVVANMVAVQFAGAFWVLPLVQLLIVALYFLVEKRKDIPVFDDLLLWLERRNGYRKSYTQLVFSLVMLTCVLPGLSFAVITYNKEKEIAVKTVQLGVMEQLAAGNHKHAVKEDAKLRLTEYYSPFYGTTIEPGMDFCETPDAATEIYDRFSSMMREQIQNAGERYNRMQFGAHDSLWRWCYQKGNYLAMTGRDNAPFRPDYGYQLKSEVPVFELPFFFNAGMGLSVRFWVSGIAAILLLYYVLRFFTGKVFAHEKYSRSRSLKFDQEFFDKAEPGYKAFVTGMPSAGKSAYFAGKKFSLKLDFVATPPSAWQAIIDEANQPGEGVVIIDHFEHNVLDRDLNKAKLELIEQLVSNRQKKVMIISSVSPATYLNIFQRGNAEAAPDDEKLYERWNRVFAAFYDFIFPLQGYTQRSIPLAAEFAQRLPQGEEIAVPDKLIDLVETECNHGTFLRAIGVELLGELHDRREISSTMREIEKWEEREDLIIRTQNLAKNYYRSLWNHLAVEEQFVLYDLAQDGLVNPKNLDIVEDMIDKGIIVYSTRLRIMNRSFRNYIITVAGPEDVARMELQVKDAGAWSKLKPALLLIVLALFLFILKSDRSQLFGYFTAFAAIIPIVVGLFGVFNQAGKKE